MATVRESITALYEQSRKSAGQGQAMLAVIESEAMSPDEADFDIPSADARPSIARRFDDLRDLAEREARDDTSPDDAPTPTDGMVGAPDDFTAGSFGGTPDTVVGFEDAVPDIAPQAADDAADTLATPDLPSEPPAPATGDALSDLGVADIQELVRQAWEDEAALGRIAVPHDDNPPRDDDNSDADAEDDPDIAAAMEEIAAAVVQSGDAAIPVDLDGMKADIVAAMRAELQAVVATDLRPMIRAAIAEALQELPAAKPAPRAKKAATKKASTKKSSTKKSAATTARKTGRKTAPAGTSKAATITESDANTSDATRSDATRSDATKSDAGDSET